LAEICFVLIAAFADQFGVGVVDRTRLGALAARDREPLLGQMRAREVVVQVAGRKDQPPVIET
jgi:hypothetical protein